MRQESHRIIRWKQRKTDHISKDDQHKEVVQVSSFLPHYQDRLMEQKPIHDLADHFGRVFHLRGEIRKHFPDQIDSLLSYGWHLSMKCLMSVHDTERVCLT